MKRNTPLVLLMLSALPLWAAETTIKGGRMELINQGDIVLFTDGVRLDRGGDRMESSRMKTNKTRDKVTAEGDVRLFRQVSSTETWHGFGETGFYNTQSATGYLIGIKGKKAHVIHTEILSTVSSRVVHVYANRIDFFRDTRKAFAQGAVQGQTIDPDTKDRYDFWSEEAHFDGEKNEIRLSGTIQPIVMQVNGPNKKTIWGDVIVYNTDTKHLVSEGKAQAVFEDEEEKK